MKTTKLFLSAVTLTGAAALLLPTDTEAFGTEGASLGLAQRDVRVFNNFTDAQANNNVTPDANFPGYVGADLSIWKSIVEWGSRLHGDGQGDPHQPFGLGSGGANFDASWQGNATGVGGTNDNIHSELASSDPSTLAYTETPISNGWRIRYLSNWTWADGPGTSIGFNNVDIQGVSTHEYGHALGLGHSSDCNGGDVNTMRGCIHGSGVADRSIEAGDITSIQNRYGAKSASKPIITDVSINLNQVTIIGGAFSATGNDVWFTQASAGGNGTPVKVVDVNSSAGQIVVTLPGNAGPGDVLVQKDASGGAALSNAWPFDPMAGPTCDPGNFCTTSPNSVGPGAVMGWLGSTSIAANDFQYLLNGLPPTSIGIFYTGNATTFVPFGNGVNCVGGAVLRFGVSVADVFGSVQRPLDFNAYPGNQMSDDGTEWNTQFWYRNPAGGGAGFNTSDGVTTRWCP